MRIQAGIPPFGIFRGQSSVFVDRENDKEMGVVSFDFSRLASGCLNDSMLHGAFLWQETI